MRHLKYLLLLAFVAVPVAYSQAQVSIGVQIGPDYGYYNPPPVCEFGYYPYYPFDCAPYGYWGPQWFVDGFFIGAGPWYRWYYVHPEFYRVYRRDWDRRFGRDFHERAFRGGDFHDRGFRGGDREFRGYAYRGGEGHGFRGNEGGRSFNGGNRAFRGGGERGFRGGEGRSFHGGGGGFRGESHARNGNGGGHGGGGGHSEGGGHGHGGGHGRG